MGDILNRRWNFDEVNKIISRDETVDATGGPTVAANRNQVNELYSAIQDQIDEPSFMTSRNPMTAETPELYTMRNGWFIDARSTEWLEGSAIQTNGWTGNVIAAISFNATTMFTSADIGRTITGTTTTDSGTILGYDDRYALNDQGVVYIRPDDPATDLFDNATEAYTVGGSSAAGSFTNVFDTGGARSGENLIANPFTLGTVQTHTELYIYQDSARVVSREVNPTERLQWWDTDTTVSEGHIDILLTVQEAGTLIDSGLIQIFARRATSLYDHFQSNQAGGTRTPVPIAQGNDNLNDADGFREMVLTTAAGNFSVGDRIEDDTDATIRGVITSVTGSNPNITLQYYLIGDPLNDFTGATGAFSNLDDTGTATAVAPTNVNGAVASGITVTFGQTTLDINNGAGARPYSITVDCNSQPLADVYQRLKYLTRRGETALLNGEEGESYRGNELRLDYNTQAGGAWTQGNLIYGQTSGAIARIIADDDQGTTGTLMLSSIKGTFGDTEQIGDAPTSPTVTANITTATQSNIAGLTPKVAPFGTFAGGTFFGAIGVALTNVQGAESNNYQLIDNLEVTQIPPATVSIDVSNLLARSEGTATSADAGTQLTDTGATFQTDGVQVDDIIWNIRDGSRAKVTSVDSQTQLTHTALAGGADNSWDLAPADEYAVMYGDTVLVARVDGNGDIITNAYNSHATNNTIGRTAFDTSAAVGTDEPSVGVIHVVGVDETNDYRYRYASRTSTVFTFVAPTNGTGNPTTTDATNGVEEMFDTGADFAGAAEPVKVGDTIRNATDGGVGVITGVFRNRLTHTPLTGGTNNDWNTADTYEINRLVQAYDGSDTAYVSVVDDRNYTEGTTQLSNTITFDTSFAVTIRVRQSGKILDFISSGTVGSGGLSVSAVRNPDTIFTRATPT